MKKLYFIVGSQDLYGEECLKQVAEDSRQMVAFLNEKVGDLAEIELLPTVETSEICIQDMRKASNDDDCVGVITWMHTFSPAKMWIKGLQELSNFRDFPCVDCRCGKRFCHCYADRRPVQTGRAD